MGASVIGIGFFIILAIGLAIGLLMQTMYSGKSLIFMRYLFAFFIGFVVDWILTIGAALVISLVCSLFVTRVDTLTFSFLLMPAGCLATVLGAGLAAWMVKEHKIAVALCIGLANTAIVLVLFVNGKYTLDVPGILGLCLNLPCAFIGGYTVWRLSTLSPTSMPTPA